MPAPMEKGTQEFSQRRKFRELVDDELEQSLNSINIFDHSHRGRITSDLDLEKDQGTIVSTYFLIMHYCTRVFARKGL